MQKLRKVLLAGVAAALAATSCAPLAQADTQQDQMFIAYLDSHGVSARIPDMNSAVQSGHLACQDLAAGKGEINTEMDVVAANPSGLSRADASWIIGAAKRAFCP
jgi:hypothetical protein